jgi:hypothetical protein
MNHGSCASHKGDLFSAHVAPGDMVTKNHTYFPSAWSDVLKSAEERSSNIYNTYQSTGIAGPLSDHGSRGT